MTKKEFIQKHIQRRLKQCNNKFSVFDILDWKKEAMWEFDELKQLEHNIIK